MKIEPVLINTSGGVVGAMVTSPSGPPRATALIFQAGAGCTRSGLNQLQTRMAISFAGLGIRSLRFDYVGIGESHLGEPSRWADVSTEVVGWFRENWGADRPLVVAECAGILSAHVELLTGREVLAVGHVLPPMFSLTATSAPAGGRRARRIAGRVKRWPRSKLFRLRYGPPDPRLQTMWPSSAYLGGGGSLEELSRGRDGFGELLIGISKRAPLWILSSAADPSTAKLQAVHDRLAAGVDYQLEVIPRPQGQGRLPGTAEVVKATEAWAIRRLLVAQTGEGPPPEMVAQMSDVSAGVSAVSSSSSISA